ncbi:hypothetical protein [Streptomyces sp. NPDC053069]|uniref:DUF7739 domain-containing protein n=1 Tax=Streptomyces sp. NPDC053069 TaxID=3365695 RepID=UPI0037D0BB41
MSTHITVSHGGDFEGVDIVPVRQLRDLGQYARTVLPAVDHPPLTALLGGAGERQHSFDAGQAALLAVLLRRVAAHRRLKKPFREPAARLGIAAANAAADSEPWTWTTSTADDRRPRQPRRPSGRRQQITLGPPRSMERRRFHLAHGRT